jgi:hypothetical protein
MILMSHREIEGVIPLKLFSKEDSCLVNEVPISSIPSDMFEFIFLCNDRVVLLQQQEDLPLVFTHLGWISSGWMMRGGVTWEGALH